MKLYNTASRTIETIKPLNHQQIGLYACGPTVYDYTHIGHLRKYTMDDVLVRVLRRAGWTVKFVQNITDVGHLTSDGDTGEDKLEKGAKKYKKTVWDIAHEFEDYFWYSMDALGIQRPDISCRATEHIEQQLAMVVALEKKGHTYVIEGDGVYFDVSTFTRYGQMARLKLDDQEEGARIGVVAGKRHPHDFALWKFERPGENRSMVWPSPWHKRSFPGWHIECSAMAMQYLGDQLDIHTGGIDHIPVHHTNEIAQAEAMTGKVPFVSYWVHHNFLRVDGEKMSKSLGNVFTIDDVKAKGFHPRALRLLFLTTHYRSEMNFTWQSLVGAQRSWERLVQMMKSWLPDSSSSSKTVFPAKLAERLQQWQSFLQDDLKTPEAVAQLWSITKDDSLSNQQKYHLLQEMDTIFQLGLAEEAMRATFDDNSTHPVVEITPELQVLLTRREQARDAKNWVVADQVRDTLLSLGYTVIDTQDGQVLVPSDTIEKV